MAKVARVVGKSNVEFPDHVNFHKALTGLKLHQPSLGILMGTTEPLEIGISMAELERLAIKLFGAQFMEAHDDIMKAMGGSGGK